MPGLTIDKLDIGIYVQYARRTQLIEQVKQQYHMPEADSIPAQALIVDLYPRLSELEMLLGIPSLASPWAYFYAPRDFSSQRRSLFTFHKILPSIGERKKKKEGDKEGKEEKSEEELLDEIECVTDEDEREKHVLKKCFKQIAEINSLLRYIGGRIGQFLQG